MSEETPPSSPKPDSKPRSAARPGPRSNRTARLVVGLSIVGLLLFAGATAGVLVLAGDQFGAGEVADGSFLEVKAEGISDAPGDAGMVLDPKQFPPVLTEVTSGIRKAAKDERITGLYLEVEGIGLGWAGLQELRDALVAFKESGKPCYAYGETFENKSYFLASACQVYAPPGGLMLVNGLSVTTEYYAGTFEKIGVVANFEHVGDFKSAVEPYQRTAPSEPASLAMDELLDELYGQLVAGIASGRGIDEAAARALVDDPPVTPESAVARGMLDGLKYRDEVKEGMAGEERTSIDDYVSEGASLGSNRTLAVVHVDGAIISGESGSPLFGGNMVGDQSIAKIFKKIRDDEDVVAVVMRVNSPGGSGLASDMMWREIELTKAAGKPVVVSMGDYAASGGYYISAGADRIVAEPGTLTGSIGVFGGKMAIAGTYEKLGVTTHTWQRGALAGLLSENTSFSEPERMKFREFLTGFYETFLNRVATGRKMERDAVHQVAQGRVWTGRQAVEKGLVDELGGLDVAIARAREVAKIPEDEELDIERLPKRRTLIDQLAEDFQETRVPVEATLPGVEAIYRQMEILTRVLGNGGVAAMMPGTLDVR